MELSDADSRARARALIARAYLDPDQAGDAVRDAVPLADRLGDVELRSWALGAGMEEAMARGEYEEAYGWAQRRFDLLPTLDDPDHISLLLMFVTPAYVATTRFEEARRAIRAHDEVTARLTPHHRMHAAALLVDIDRITGRWDAVRDLSPRVEAAVEANIATPCASNVNSLMVCAIAHARLGDDDAALRLERSAHELGMEGYRFDGPRVALAMARGDLETVGRILAGWRPDGFGDFENLTAWIDALVALDRPDEILAEVPPYLRPGTYLEPFVLRALGFARGDDGLREQAIRRFDEMGMTWHAAETRRLGTV
jgi:hypothetical protein